MRKLAQIQAFNGGFKPNFSAKSTNWGALTTATAWYDKIVLNEGTGVVIKSFSIVNGIVSFYLKTSNANLFNFFLNALNITEIYKQNIPNAYGLYIFDNNLTNVDSLILHNDIRDIRLNRNQLVSYNPTSLPPLLTTFEMPNNQLTSFNLSVPFPTTTTVINISNNLITTAGWTASEPWAASMPTTTNCTIKLSNNTNSASGTTFASILTSKGYTLIY